jgi:hypothetical protein
VKDELAKIERMSEEELEAELRKYGVDPDELVNRFIEKLCLLAGNQSRRILELEAANAELAKERDEAKRETAKVKEWNAKLNKDLDAGDSWAWIRSKFEKSSGKFRWYKPRTDELAGTRYEVMGWLHCLFADADSKVFIDITLEHQKRTETAEAERDQLAEQVQRPSGGVSLIAAERCRQIVSEGYYLEHDDQHTHGDLAIQAAALAVDGTDACITHPEYEEDESVDPWGLVTKHHGQWERELVIAGALIAAEIDRQQRVAARALPAKEKPHA